MGLSLTQSVIKKAFLPSAIVVPQKFRETCFAAGWGSTDMDYIDFIQSGRKL